MASGEWGEVLGSNEDAHARGWPEAVCLVEGSSAAVQSSEQIPVLRFPESLSERF